MLFLRALLIVAVVCTASSASSQTLAFWSGRTFKSIQGFTLTLPLDAVGCFGGYSDHGFFIFLGPNPPCIDRQNLDEAKIPFVADRAPEDGIPYIHFYYGYNAAFLPDSAYEVAESLCKNERLPDNEEVYGAKVRVSPLRFLELPGIECVKNYKQARTVSLTIVYHSFVFDPESPWTDDDGLIAPYSEFIISLISKAADFAKNRRMLERVLNAAALSTRED